MADSTVSSSSSNAPDSDSLIVIICSALAGYNALELLLLIFTTFTVYKGLYFWALMVATGGILPYAAGLCVFQFASDVRLVGRIINSVGWIAVVTGQSVVLYSRLGLLLGKGYDNILKAVKWMIIIDGIVFHSLTIAIVFGKDYAANATPWSSGYRYVEKIQMTAFCLQEFIISGLYVWKTLDILRTGRHKHAHRIMWQLFMINAIIIILDIGLLVLEYRDLFIPEVAFKVLAYSIKLKLEFAILNKLVSISRRGARRGSILDSNTADFLHEDARTLPRTDSNATSPIMKARNPPPWGLHNDDITNEKAGTKNEVEDLKSESGSASGSQYANHMYADAVRVISK